MYLIKKEKKRPAVREELGDGRDANIRDITLNMYTLARPLWVRGKQETFVI